jgi:hypothetical protein
MSFLLVNAFWNLILFDLYRARGNLRTIYNNVRQIRVGAPVATSDVVERVCSAVDLACIWYWKEVLCLQRSAAAACLLKKNGVPAELVIGAQQMPFRAHAWVEVEGRVVNDKPYMQEIYTVLDRC